MEVISQLLFKDISSTSDSTFVKKAILILSNILFCFIYHFSSTETKLVIQFDANVSSFLQTF